jgi:hypothetical protein
VVDRFAAICAAGAERDLRIAPADVAALPRRLLPYVQLCDGPFDPVQPPEDVALTEARTGRLLPGDGALPLRDLVAALPRDADLAVEAPVAALAGRPPAEIARRAYASLQPFRPSR